MAHNCFLPTVENSLKFCIFLLEVEIESYQDTNREYATEARQHKNNLNQLMKLMNGSEEVMEMSVKQYKKCEQVFGASLAQRLFKGVRLVDHDVPPTDGKKLFEAIKAKGAASRTKEVKPNGFYTESAGKAFQDVLFHRKGANGYHEAVWPKVATTFAELRQARIEGELAEQFTWLTQNILQSSEFSASVKAEMLSALASEYAKLSRGEN